MLIASPGGLPIISGYIFAVAAVATMVRRESFLLYQVPEPRTATGTSIFDSEDSAHLRQMKEHLPSPSQGLGNLSAPLSLVLPSVQWGKGQPGTTRCVGKSSPCTQ